MENKYIQYEIKEKSKYLETDYFKKEKLASHQIELYDEDIPEEYRKKLWKTTLNSNIYQIPNTNLLYKESGTCINEIVGLKMPGILFPKRKVYCIKQKSPWRKNQRIKQSGYVMEYIKGFNFADKDSKINIFTIPYQELLSIYQIIRKNLHAATELGLYFFDGDVHNVIITKNNQPVVIDHDYTYQSYDIGGSKSKLNSTQCYTLLNIIKLERLENYKIDNTLMSEYINNAKRGSIPVDEFLEIINMYHQKLIGSNIKTLTLARKNINML